MSNDFLSQILGSVLGDNAQGGQSGQGGQGGPFGTGLGAGGDTGGGLADVLGGLIGRGSGTNGGLGGLGGLGGQGETGSLGGFPGLGMGGGGSPLAGKGAALTAMLIPLAMQWVQRNGGIGAVLQRFQQKGYSQQAASWVSTGSNEALPTEAVDDVVGTDELSRLSQQLGVGEDEVKGGMARILPEVVNHLTPQGDVQPDADDMLSRGISAFEQYLKPAQAGEEPGFGTGMQQSYPDR